MMSSESQVALFVSFYLSTYVVELRNRTVQSLGGANLFGILIPKFQAIARSELGFGILLTVFQLR